MYENVWKCRIPPKKVGKTRSILIIPVATPMSSTPRRWTISSASAGGGDDGGFHHVKLGLHQDNGRYLAYLGEIDWPNAFHLQCWRVSSELGTVYGWVCRINEILVGLKSRGYSSVGGWNPFLPGIMTIWEDLPLCTKPRYYIFIWDWQCWQMHYQAMGRTKNPIVIVTWAVNVRISKQIRTDLTSNSWIWVWLEKNNN